MFLYACASYVSLREYKKDDLNLALYGINSEKVVLPSSTGDEESTTKPTEAEKATEQLTKGFFDLSKSAATSMVKNFKAQKKAGLTKEQTDDLKEARESRTKAHAADVEEIPH